MRTAILVIGLLLVRAINYHIEFPAILISFAYIGCVLQDIAEILAVFSAYAKEKSKS